MNIATTPISWDGVRFCPPKNGQNPDTPRPPVPHQGQARRRPAHFSQSTLAHIEGSRRAMYAPSTTRVSDRFRGVCWNKALGKWQAQISSEENGVRRRKHLGLFDDEEQAALAWDTAAVESGWYDNEFLRLNFSGGAE